MAYFNYEKPHNWRKKREQGSVMRVSYTKKDILKNYFSLPGGYQFIVRFSFVCAKSDQIEQAIYDCNQNLRKIFNKKALRKGIPLNGVRYITIRGKNAVVYNIVLDKLLSAIWLFSQLADLEHIQQFSWLKRDRDLPIERVEVLKAHLRPYFFNMVCKIFEENDKVAKVEADDIGLYIGVTGHEQYDLNPLLLPAWYGKRPNFRSKQYFGNLSENSRNKLNVFDKSKFKETSHPTSLTKW